MNLATLTETLCIKNIDKYTNRAPKLCKGNSLLGH